MVTPRIYRMQASFLHMEASGVSQWLRAGETKLRAREKAEVGHAPHMVRCAVMACDIM